MITVGAIVGIDRYPTELCECFFSKIGGLKIRPQLRHHHQRCKATLPLLLPGRNQRRIRVLDIVPNRHRPTAGQIILISAA